MQWGGSVGRPPSSTQQIWVAPQQVSPQHAAPARHSVLHGAAIHRFAQSGVGSAHLTPHAPQLSGSFCVTTHLPSQQVSPFSHPLPLLQAAQPSLESSRSVPLPSSLFVSRALDESVPFSLPPLPAQAATVSQARKKHRFRIISPPHSQSGHPMGHVPNSGCWQTAPARSRRQQISPSPQQYAPQQLPLSSHVVSHGVAMQRLAQNGVSASHALPHVPQ